MAVLAVLTGADASAPNNTQRLGGVTYIGANGANNF
jgi:hypothetical protein